MNRIFLIIGLLLLLFGCAQKQLVIENCQNSPNIDIPKEWLAERVAQSEVEQHINKANGFCKGEALKNYHTALADGGISWSFGSLKANHLGGGGYAVLNPVGETMWVSWTFVH